MYFILCTLLALPVLLNPTSYNFKYDKWRTGLQGFEFADTVWDGITTGFDIGWIPNTEPTYVDDPVIPTTVPQDLSITNWIVSCHQMGILLGPFLPATVPYATVFIAPLWTRIKPNFKRRVVCNLSNPKKWGVSVNDCIDPAAKAVQYITFVELCQFVYDLGHDARLWVVDAQDAYYRVPIKEPYWKYMGIKWFGVIFLFTSLQMGLASACQIYQLFADAVLYIIVKTKPKLFWTETGLRCIEHYLDDFFGGHQDPKIATKQVLAVEKIFADLGIPTQRRKLKFPNWNQIWLGWDFNTRRRDVAVPDDKVLTYTYHITTYIRERDRGATKKDLERLKGGLQWAAPVVYPGKSRLRNLDHAMHLEAFDYKDVIILSDLVIEDLKWWRVALQHANGVPLTWIIQDPKQFDDEVWTDAATTVGAGGCTRSQFAFQYWNSQTWSSIVKIFRKGVDIKLLEFIAVYVMAFLMKDKWKFKNIKFYCDNDVVVSSLAHQRSPLKRRDLNYLVQKFAELSARYHFRFWIADIDGKDNVLADDLSRFKSAYRNGNSTFDGYQFFDQQQAIAVANSIFKQMLDPRVVPLNDDDTSHVVMKTMDGTIALLPDFSRFEC